MKQIIRSPSLIEKTIQPPGDKSISQRAIILNSIAQGTAHVSNLCEGDDRTAILRCLRGLGVRIVKHSYCPINQTKECFEIHGHGMEGLSEPVGILNAGNSATSLRLVSGLLATQSFLGIITGDPSLRARPMTRIVRPLTEMGAQIMGRGDDSLAPLAIRGGGLKGINFSSTVASSQVKSSILIAGLYADGQTTVEQPIKSRDHTELMLRSMGADLEIDGPRISVRPSELSPVNMSIPGDMSATAFWIIAGCCHPNARIRIQGVGVNPTRTGMLKILESMGAKIALENIREVMGEPLADIVAESSDLVATEISGDIIPTMIDELPALAVAACFAKGTTTIRNASELRVKESDRILATVEGLSKLGANIQELPDGLVIRGVGSLTGGVCHSHRDHRIAMSMAIAGLIASGETVIEGAEAASISYPGFWDTIKSLSQHQQD